MKLRTALPVLFSIILMCFVTSSCDETRKTAASTPIKRPIKSAQIPQKPAQKSPPTEEAGVRRNLVKFTNSIMLDQAILRAKAENKPIFVDFYTDFCAPCKIMDEYVFSAPDLAGLLNSNFVNYHFNGMNFDADPFLAKYNVKSYPTLLFLRPDGSVLKTITGSLGYTDMKHETQTALAAFKAGK